MADLPVIELPPESPNSVQSPQSSGGFPTEGGIAQPHPTTRAATAGLSGGGQPEASPEAAPAPEVSPDATPAPSLNDVAPVEPSTTSKNVDFTTSVEEALRALEDSGAATDPNNRSEAKPAEGTEGANGAEAKPEAASEDKPDLDDGDPTKGLDEFDQTPTEGWTPKAAKAFERIKSQRKQVITENEELKAQIAQRDQQMQELKGAMKAEDIAELQTRIQEFEQQQMFTNLEATTAYQEAITQPLTQRLMTLDQIAERAEADPDALIDLVTEVEDPNNLPEYDSDGRPYVSRDQRIQELLAKAGPRDQAAVFHIMTEVEELMATRNEMYQHADQAFQEAQLLEQTRAEKAAADAAKQRVNISNAVLDQIVNRVPFISEMEGLDLAKVKTDVAAVDVKALHPVDAQYYAATAKLFPAVVNDLVSAQAEIEQLTAKLAEFDEAEPNAGGQGQGQSAPRTVNRGGVPHSADSGASPDFTASVNRALAEMGIGG